MRGACWHRWSGPGARRLSEDFDLLVELIAHVLADQETSMLQVAHDQAVARQKQKLVADIGVTMHLAWARHMPKGANHIN